MVVGVGAASTFAVRMTRGAGVSESGAPIQRTTSPFEYVCVAGKTSVVLVGRHLRAEAELVELAGGDLAALPGHGVDPLRHGSPSSFVTGLASFTVVTVLVQPGFGWKLDEREIRGQLHHDLRRVRIRRLVRDAEGEAGEAVRRHRVRD